MLSYLDPRASPSGTTQRRPSVEWLDEHNEFTHGCISLSIPLSPLRSFSPRAVHFFLSCETGRVERFLLEQIVEVVSWSHIHKWCHGR